MQAFVKSLQRSRDGAGSSILGWDSLMKECGLHSRVQAHSNHQNIQKPAVFLATISRNSQNTTLPCKVKRRNSIKIIQELFIWAAQGSNKEKK